jgi:hypothetical protein
MKQLFFILICMAMVFSCSKDLPTASKNAQTTGTEKPTTEQLALEVISQFEWPLDEESVAEYQTDALAKNQIDLAPTGRVMNFDRTLIADNIYHYSFTIHVGSGAYDVIGLHRVVKEKGPFRPIKTQKTFFYQHGDAKDFTGMTLPGTLSPATANDFGIAVYLAKNDVDVWGIDQAWTLVPAEVTDHSFMVDWGLQKQIDDLTIAMSVARFTRLFTGSGFGQLILCGYSSGVATGYALLNDETQRPDFLRNASAFISVDLSIKDGYEPLRAADEAEYYRLKAEYDDGLYGQFIPFNLLAVLARSDPDGDSPVIPGFTNMQSALFFACGPFLEVVSFHYFGATWENDFPSDPEYTTLDQAFDFMEAGVPWESTLFMMDYLALMSDAVDVPFDDHLAQIQVPIFNVCPAGGFGELGHYGTTLIGSTDITHLDIQLKADGEHVFDYGHIDVFTAFNAPELVWQPILEWIDSHTF